MPVSSFSSRSRAIDRRMPEAKLWNSSPISAARRWAASQSGSRSNARTVGVPRCTLARNSESFNPTMPTARTASTSISRALLASFRMSVIADDCEGYTARISARPDALR